MRKELPHFYIGDSYGGNQDWFSEYMMRLGGCAAETACDSSIYFDLYCGTKLYPYELPESHFERSEAKSRNLEQGNTEELRRDYCRFATVMKPYIRPRWSGVYLLSMYIDGYAAFLKDRGESRISMAPFSGERPYKEAEAFVKKQIDAGYPIPTLILDHKNRAMKEYVWHWFLINAYDDGDPSEVRPTDEGRPLSQSKNPAKGLVPGSELPKPDGIFRVKALTYSEYEWLDLSALWDTGEGRKGGFIEYSSRSPLHLSRIAL